MKLSNLDWIIIRVGLMMELEGGWWKHVYLQVNISKEPKFFRYSISLDGEEILLKARFSLF